MADGSQKSHALDDVYAAQPDEDYPGAKQRSRPGQGPYEEVYEKVLDPLTGRSVSLKPANKAFLASRARRAAHAASKPSSSIPTPSSNSATRSSMSSTNQSSLSWRQVLLVLLFLPLLSQFLTSTYTFTISSRLAPPLRKWWSRTPINIFRADFKEFTLDDLAKFDGSDPWLPVYLAIDGDVYDVTKNRRIYGRGGSYNLMTGIDASRSFVTGCFATHRTHDLRGLSPEELKSLDHWKSFFATHEKYTLIGRVLLPPIDPDSPIPPPCDDSAPGEAASARGSDAPGPVSETASPHHQEL
ncbi:cytochrome b5-like heme/steroid binding domain-containing protein [Naematelia encephala]|uniref:Cytochrome b5-like heme/steroid binding domain-containing protein n=1 Tax=Naematelia encephala TaxID=71784 RepID=A0A1Y2AXM7_9TREE|nr:cytochrome b5-like heme/steroid binding domain-containing protein [Naematelia encephala]